MERRNSGIDERQEAAIALLVTGQKPSVVATKVGISDRTLRQWRGENRAFMSALAAAQAEVLRDGIARANGLLDDALDTVVQARADRQLAEYRTALATTTDVHERVRQLADLRSSEGYLAEVLEADDHVDLVEHHCPIQGAAHACESLCDGELDLFRKVLGPAVSVAREHHVLHGGQRCSYRIQPR